LLINTEKKEQIMKLHKPILSALVILALSAYQINRAAQAVEDASQTAQAALPRSAAAYQGGGQTAPGAALQGTSQVIASAGQYNLATSAGAVNMTQAESNDLRNQVQRVATFWAMRNLGAAARARERGPRPTAEERARRASAGAPRALSTGQIDPLNGTLYWPPALQYGIFELQRTTIDGYTAKWAKYGGLDYGDQAQVRENIAAMFGMLRSQITSIPPQDYVACRTFLQSILYATTRSIL
jgi:hypothetical protein